MADQSDSSYRELLWQIRERIRQQRITHRVLKNVRAIYPLHPGTDIADTIRRVRKS
jgi:hypothetical protein